MLGEQPRAVELLDRSGDRGGISGASPGAPALAPGRGTPSHDLSLEALGSQHPVASPDQAEWPVQRAALEQESSGDETENGDHCVEIGTETPGPSPPGHLSPHQLLWPHSASRPSSHQHDPTHDPLTSRVDRGGGRGSLLPPPSEITGLQPHPDTSKSLVGRTL